MTHNIQIIGMTVEGQRFRPSDWASRLMSIFGEFRNGTFRYPSNAQIRFNDEHKVDEFRINLTDEDIEYVKYLEGFAIMHDLYYYNTICDGDITIY